MYTVETNDDNAVEVETDVSLNVFDVLDLTILKNKMMVYRINDLHLMVIVQILIMINHIKLQ